MSKDDRKRYLILKDPNIIKGLFILALPLMLNNLAKTLHDLIDMFFVSKIPGFSDDAVASINVTFSTTFTFIALGMGLMVAGTTLISQYYGSNQFEEARKYATQLIVITFLLGVVLNIVSFFLSPHIMRWMGNDGFTLVNSSAYLRIRSFELPFLFMFFGYTAVRQASGDTVTPVLLGVTAMIINSILSPILITVFGLGVPGAAYATVAANVLIMPFGIYKLTHVKEGISISFKYFKIIPHVIKDIITMAIPASFGQAFTAIGFTVLTFFIRSYGVETTAAFGIGNRITSMFLHPVMAIGGIMAAYIGQNIGNLNEDRAYNTFRKGLILSIGLMSFGSLIGLALRKPIGRLFLEDGTAAFELATTYMFYLFLALPLMAVFQSLIGVFNGTGRTDLTFWLGVTRLWFIRLPLIVFFKYFTDLGSSGIWFAIITSNIIISIIGFILFRGVSFKPKIDVDKKLRTKLVDA
ncbi:MAG: MATE family efflux transporter [Candidatus Izimaplasma sp.]|nr:MATE family efflux transporter [Candidatus Izimaplasma bacterium]